MFIAFIFLAKGEVFDELDLVIITGFLSALFPVDVRVVFFFVTGINQN